MEKKIELLREPSNQSEENKEFLSRMEKYFTKSPGSINSKLENFTKYVSRESLTKFLVRNEIFKKQLNVHGSIIDLGVARGASLLSWAQFSAIYEPSNYYREIIGFDTFSGIPKLHKNDRTPSGTSEYLEVGGFSIEDGMESDIKEAIELYDLTRYLNHIGKVNLISGDIEKTLPLFLDNNPHLIISLLNIDVDIYNPTKKALELLFPRIPIGGIILFDELNSKLFPGETQAVADVIGINKLKLNRFQYAPSVSYTIIQ